MNPWVRLVAATWIAGVAVAGLARAEDAAQRPYEMVRMLQILQDQVALGNATAHIAQRAMLEQISDRLDKVGSAAWEDPRNVRAAIVFALSGGSPRVLKMLQAAKIGSETDQKVVRAALAYVEGRSKEAIQLFAGIDAANLPANIAGHLALIRGDLLAKDQPQAALAFLDQARLLSPGSLTEEAALRRQATIRADAGTYDKFEVTCANYLRRFPHSIFGGTLKQRFAAEASAHLREGGLRGLESMLSALDPADQRDFYLLIARQAVAKGNVVLTRFAAGKVASLAEDASLEKARSNVYEAAVLVATSDVDRGRAALGDIPLGRLPKEDVELIEAAKSVADEVSKPIEPATAVLVSQGADAGRAPPTKIVGTVQDAILRVDRLLKVERK